MRASGAWTGGTWLAVLLVAGCAMVPLASEERDAAAKRFQPSDGRASVYVYRPAALVGSLVANPVYVDGVHAGTLTRGTFLDVELAPGEHTLYATAERDALAVLDAEPGGVAYFRVEPRWGTAAARVRLVRVEDERAAREEIRECRRVAAPPPAQAGVTGR